MTRLVGVYGASGYGREVMPLVRAQAISATCVFIDDGRQTPAVNGHDLVDWEGFLSSEASERAVSIAIAASSIREALALRCDAVGVPLIEVRAPNVVQMDDVVVEDGACLSSFVTLTSNIRIGRCFHANLYSYVAHDCVIGDFVTLAPSAKINGNVTIGDHAYIGTGAIIRQGLTIGPRAVVGMGAVVTRDVPPDVTVVGNPARALSRN